MPEAVDGKEKRAHKKATGVAGAGSPGATGGRTVRVYSLKGGEIRSVELPEVFSTPVRLDLIRRDFTAIRAGRRQPYGPSRLSGMKHSVEWWGKGRGVSRVTRIKDQFRGAQAPNTVGGRPANPPRPERVWVKKVNRKERLLARSSALGATCARELVLRRGHRFKEGISLPVVLEDDFEKLETTKDVIDALRRVGVYEDVERTWSGKHQRAGKGKMRGRRFRSPKSLLIVVSRKDGVERGARNLAGVDIATPRQLNTELLAPGGAPGRLSLFTESAIEELRRWRHG
ncbi:MAG: 50S ribosomal protein L4 [Thermoplasmatota archaeon]